MWKPGLNNEEAVPMEKEVSMMFVANDYYKNNPKEYFQKVATISWKKGCAEFLEKNNSKRAMKYFNESVKYLPYETSALMIRGLCRYDLGDVEGAHRDWERINALGKYNADDFIDELVQLKGYQEMIASLKK